MFLFKKYILFYFLIGFFNGLLAQDKTIIYFDQDWKPCSKEKASYYREIYYQYERKPTSIVKDYYKNGKLQWEGKLISENPDVLDSICTWYDNKGRVTEQRTFKSGQLNGAYTLFYPDGSVMQKNMYADGVLHGLSFSYWPNGVEHTRINYKKGKLEGESLEFHDNGKLENYKFYLEDTIRGPDIRYDTSGKNMLSYLPHNRLGLVDGFWLMYHSNGMLWQKQIYIAGKHVGPDTSWYDNGVIENIMVLNAQGLYKRVSYHKDGSVKGEDSNIEYPDTVTLHIAKDNINCLYGIKNYKKEWVVPPQYTYISLLYSDRLSYFKTHQNNKYGIISVDGHLKIEPIYEDIGFLRSNRRFYNSPEKIKADTLLYLMFKMNGVYGLIDWQNGSVVIPAQYQSISDLPGDLFAVKKNDLYGIADTSGMILQTQYGEILGGIEDSLFLFRPKYQDSQTLKGLGVMDIRGKTIIPPLYDNYRVYYNKKDSLVYFWTIFNRNERSIYGLYNSKGVKLLETEYTMTESGLPEFDRMDLGVIIKNHKLYLINQKGQILSDSVYDVLDILPVVNGKTCLGKSAVIYGHKDLRGLLDHDGNILIHEKYNSLESFRYVVQAEDHMEFFRYLYVASLNGKFGIINEKDSIIYPFFCDFALMDNDKLLLGKDHKILVLNPNNLQTLDWRFNYNEYGIAVFSKDHNWYDSCYCSGVVNDSGTVLLQPVYLISEFNNYKAMFSDEKGFRGYIYDDGRIQAASKQNYRQIGEFIDGTAWALSYGGKMGIIDEFEHLLIDTLYDAVSDFDTASGTCWVKPTIKIDAPTEEEDYGDKAFRTYNGWGLMNRAQQWILDTVHNYPAVFVNKHAIVIDSSFNKGLVRQDGWIALPFKYQEIRRQKNGQYLIKHANKWGFAEADGQIIIQPVWSGMTDFMGKFAFFEKDSTIGMVDSLGRITYTVEKVYNQTNRCLFDSLVFAAEQANNEEYFMPEADDILIENLELTDSILNIKNRNITRNRLCIAACQNFFIDNKTWNEEHLPEIHFDTEKFKYDDDWAYGVYAEGINYNLRVISVNKKTFAIDRIEEEYYSPPRGMGYVHYSHQLYNYAYRSDSLIQLSLKDLFIRGYAPILNNAIMKGMRTIDDPDIDCTNPEQYLENLENSFVITSAGIVFYLSSQDSEDEEALELLIPYSAIKGIINKKGVLSEFIK